MSCYLQMQLRPCDERTRLQPCRMRCDLSKPWPNFNPHQAIPFKQLHGVLHMRTSLVVGPRMEETHEEGTHRSSRGRLVYLIRRPCRKPGHQKRGDPRGADGGVTSRG